MTPGAQSAPGRRVGAFDGLRAYALGGVVLFHLIGIAGVVRPGEGGAVDRILWTVFGNTIDFFFIISGFLLFLPVIRRGGEIGRISDFYLKRLSRLQPEYWACLVVVVLMIVTIPVDFPPPTPTIGDFALHFFDLQTAYRLFDPEYLLGFWIDGALWMVPVMAGLYIVFPLVARSFYRHIWTGLFIAAVITVTWKSVPVHFPGVFQSISGNVTTDENVAIIATDQSPAFFYAFAAGMAAAWVFTKARQSPDSPWIKRGVIAIFVLAVPAWILLSLDFTDAAIQSSTGFDGSSRGRGLAWNGLGASTLRTLLVLGVILGPLWLQRPFASRPAGWIADQSYGLYLIHLPIAFYAGQLLDLPQSGTIGALAIWCLVVLPPAVAYAWLSHRYIGVPSIRAVEKWIKGRPEGSRQA